MSKQRKKLNRQEAIYQLALAGISSAVALLFVWLSVIVRFSTVAFYIAASLAIMIPLTKRYYLAGFFAYGVASALGFVIAGDIYTVAGFVAYFGPMALLTGIMCNKKVKWFVALPVKIVYIRAGSFVFCVPYDNDRRVHNGENRLLGDRACWHARACADRLRIAVCIFATHSDSGKGFAPEAQASSATARSR